MNLLNSIIYPDTFKAQFFLVFVSIVVYFLSMPGSPLPLLTCIAFVPIALAISEASPRRAAFLFYIAAMGCILIVIWWLIPAVVKFTRLNVYLAFIVLIVFSMILSIPYAIVGWVVSYKKWFDHKFGTLLISACFVVVVTLFPRPLPGNYAHSLYEYPMLIQLLDIGGVPILLFAVLFVNLQLVKAIRLANKDSSRAIRALLIALVTIGLVCLYGVVKIKKNEQLASDGHQLKVGIVQPKLERESSLDRLYSMSEQLVRVNPNLDLIVWPEFPTAFSYVGNPRDKANVDQMIARLKVPVVIVSGYIYEEGADPSNPKAQYFNTAHLIDKNRKLKASYPKQTLVPFFEYLPYEETFPFLRELFPDTLRYVPGENTELFHLDEDTHIIPLICYEIVFPGMTQKFVGQGGNLIINLTNDIWLGDTQGSAYHFALGLFRAVEHRLPWVRATNSGISGLVSAVGKIDPTSITRNQSKATRVYDVVIPKERSFYSQFGDVFLFVLIGFLTISLFRKNRLKK